jgi:dihydroorotate dehydrogenase (NAD+) catalytic subunit
MDSAGTVSRVDLGSDLGGLRLSHPTLTCSGTCGYATEYADWLDFSRLGAFVTKSVTLKERLGNSPTRIVETRAGMLNAIGLANVGLERFLAEKLPLIASMPCPVIVNVAGHSTDDYVQTAGRVAEQSAVKGVELNVSCPNVKDGLTFGTDPARLRQLVRVVKDAVGQKPLMVKLSPNVEDIVLTAAAAIEGGADVLTLVNTFTAMSIDIRTRKPRLANVTGGLSGPAIRPIAVHLVSRVYRGVARSAGVPIVGMGGIQTWEDAAEFILAGASAVSIGTSLFVDPAVPVKVGEGLSTYCHRMGVTRLSDLVGTLQLPGDGPTTAPNHQPPPPKTAYV